MICPYCNAENDDSTDRCTTCLKHFPHVDQLPNFDRAQASTLPAPMTQPALLEPVAPDRPNQPVSGVQMRALVLSCLGAALCVGGVYFAISRVLDLFIIFPLIAGIAVGSIIGRQVTKRIIRNVWVVGAFAILAGILTYGTKITCEAYSMRPTMVQQFGASISEARGVSLSDGQAIADRALTPVTTVRIYLLALATVGIRVGHAASAEESGAVISGTGFWLLLLLECGLIAGFALIGAVAAASAPFCESCQRWRRTEHLIRKHPKQAPQLIELVRRQDWSGALALPLAGSIGDKVICRVSALYCPKCHGGAVQVASTLNGRTSRLFTAKLSGDAMQALRSVDQPAAAMPVSGAV